MICSENQCALFEIMLVTAYQPNVIRSSPVDRLRLREETLEDVQAKLVVPALEARMRDSRHHGEVLVGIRQQLEELDQVIDARNPVPLPAHDERCGLDPGRIADR